MNFHRCCGALHRCWLLEEFPPFLEEFPPLLDEFPPLLDEFPPHAEEFPPCIVHMRRNSHRMRRNSHRTRRNFRPSGVSLPLVPRCISAVLLAISEDYFCFLRFFSVSRSSSVEGTWVISFFLPSFCISQLESAREHQPGTSDSAGKSLFAAAVRYLGISPRRPWGGCLINVRTTKSSAFGVRINGRGNLA